MTALAANGRGLMEFRVAVFLAAILLQIGQVAAAPKTIIFPFDLIDNSQPPGELPVVNADETQRLKLVRDELGKLIGESGKFDVVDSSAIAADIENAQPIYTCNGCEDDLAKKAGADLAIVGTVQKVSAMILTVNVYVRDVVNGRVTQALSTGILGNTDELWLRGIRSLVKNQLLTEGAPQ